jgi:hypothetical protein
MIDADRLDRILCENIEQLCLHFFPFGRRVGPEWKVGNTAGERGDSLGIQLTGPKAGQWHDRATGEGGTFPKLLMANDGLSFPEACRLIGDFQGISLEIDFVASESRPKTDAKRVPPTPKPETSSMNDFDWTPAVRKFDPDQQQQLSTERMFSTHTVAWLSDRLEIGMLLIRGKLCIAFPVVGTNGQVVGAHCRWPEKDARGKHDWFYTPSGLEIRPLVLRDLEKAKRALLFESYWDANTLVDRLALCDLIDSGEIAVICTRGADFGDRLSKITLPRECALFAFPQNDDAGEGWLNSVVASIGREMRVVRTPESFKDLNDWTRAGAERAELVAAIEAAEICQPQKAKANTTEHGANTQRSEGRYDPEVELPLEEQIYPYPKIDEAAFYGPFGRIVKAIAPLTEADSAAVLIQLLVGWGNLIGRCAYYSVGVDHHFTNLFCCVVGRTAKARKGLGLGVAGWVLKQLDQAWFEQNIWSGLSSGEGLIWRVRDPIVKSRAVTGKKAYPGQREYYVDDEGIKDKRLLVAETEFGSAFTVMGRSGNNLSHVIRDAFDSKRRLGQMVKNSPGVATEAHISIIGHITAFELRTLMKECEQWNGFGNRFYWVCAKRAGVYSEPSDLEEAGIGAELALLADATKWAKEVEQMDREEEAKALWDVIYRDFAEDDGEGVVAATIDRGDVFMLRFQQLFALADHALSIRSEHVRAAQALWKYGEDSARYLFGDRLGNPKAEKIFDALRQSSGGLTRAEINKGLFKGNLKAEVIEQALELLKKVGWIEGRTEKTGGRDAERFFSKK